jgi:hypothetical protein
MKNIVRLVEWLLLPALVALVVLFLYQNSQANPPAKTYLPLVVAEPTHTPTVTPTPTLTPVPTQTPTPAPAPVIGGCGIFPPNNIWNTRIDALPTDIASSNYIDTIGRSVHFHADFGSGLWDGGPIGIPYVVVPTNQPLVGMTFEYNDESDPGPYPVPTNAPIEGGPQSGGDRHVLIVRSGDCKLFEIYHSYPQSNGSWQSGSGAVFDLTSNTLRTAGWTSADAAGLPILPGQVRYDEVANGQILHAIRFTVPQTRAAYIWPARHLASDLTGAQYPPMGERFRLKSGYAISGFSPEIQVILIAMKRYGIILADNGAPWYFGGAPDTHWNNDHLHEMDILTGDDFEAVDESGLKVSPDSAQTVH